MTKEKNRHIEQLVKEQLDAGHIEAFMSPWNTAILLSSQIRKMAFNS